MAGQHKCLAVKALTKTLKNGAYAAGNAVRPNGGTLAELRPCKYANSKRETAYSCKNPRKRSAGQRRALTRAWDTAGVCPHKACITIISHSV